MDLKWSFLAVTLGMCIVTTVVGQTTSATSQANTTDSSAPSDLMAGYLATGIPFDSDVEFRHLTAVTLPIAELENSTLQFPGIYFDDFNMLLLACDTDYARKEVYLFDYASRKIELLENFNLNMKLENMNRSDYQLALSETWNLIAVDWVNHNVYWTDGIHGKIFVKKGGPSEHNRAHHVVKSGLKRPRGIAVDPLAGYIFWTDIQDDVIKRASLVGSNDFTVAVNGIAVPDAIALDLDAKILYWTDVTDINTISYDGTGRKHVYRYSSATFYDILFYQGVIIATDIEKYYTHYIDPNTRTDLFSKKGSDKEAHYGLCPFEEKPLPASYDPDLCDKYGCQHICVKEPNNIEPTCLCWDGFNLKADRKTCEAAGYPYYRGVVINTGEKLCIVSIDIMSDHKDPMPTCFYTAPENKTITHFDLNMKTREAYFSIENKVYRTDVDDTSNSATLITEQNHNILSLTFDWKNTMIYYALNTDSSTDETSIWRVNPDTNVVSPTSTPTGPSARALAVSPHEEKVFWITGLGEGEFDEIEYTDLEMQSNMLTVINTTQKFEGVTKMYHHVKSETLFLLGEYWGGKEILKMHYNGTGIGYPINVQDDIKDFALYEDYILMAYSDNDEQDISIKSSDLRYNLEIIYTANIKGIGNLYGIKVLDVELLQPQYPNPCGRTSVDYNGGCEQICYTSFTDTSKATCACYMGFTAKNATHCTSTLVQDNFILISDESYNAIFQIDLNDSMNVIGIKAPKLSTPTGIMYDWNQKMIYTTNNDLGDIVGIYLNGTSNFRSVDSYSYPDRFAYDPTSKLVYYTAYSFWADYYYDSYIGCLDMKGQHSVIYTGAHFPRAVVLYPAKGYLFFTDHGDFPGIYRVNMDGSDWVDLEIEGAVEPNGLSIDYTNDRLFWTDGFRDTIKSCDLNGQNIVEILKDVGSHPMGLKFVDGYLYYSGWNNINIKKIKVDNINDATEFGPQHSLGAIQDLDVYISGKTDQIPINLACLTNNGGCSDFCLPTPDGHSCGCPLYSYILKDNKTCDNAPRCPYRLKSGFINETDTCLLLEGNQCGFRCIENYKPKAGITSLTCTSESEPDFDDVLLWDNEDPCEEILCPMSIDNGGLDMSCDFKVNSDCSNYTCNGGYERNPLVTSLVCQLSGEWDLMGQELCIPKCPPLTHAMTHGILHPDCTRDVNKDCRVICDEGYRVAKMSSRIACLTTNRWNVSTDKVCEEILCKDYFNGGYVNETCTRKLNVVCDYQCDNGFQANADLPTIKCLGTGLWDHGGQDTGSLRGDNTVALCTVIPPKAEKSVSRVAVGAGIGAGVGVLLFLIIILVIFMRRNRSPKSLPPSTSSFENPRYAGQNYPSNGDQADTSSSYATLEEDNIGIVKNQE